VPVERKRQIHHRKLQALGGEHRHHLHGRRVVVQPACAFRCATSLVALGAQDDVAPTQRDGDGVYSVTLGARDPVATAAWSGNPWYRALTMKEIAPIASPSSTA